MYLVRMLKNIIIIIIVIIAFSCNSRNVQEESSLNQSFLVPSELIEQTKEDIGCSGLISEAKPIGDFKTLIWSDEFDNDGQICDKNWYAEIIPPNNGSWWNNELQYYTNSSNNLRVEDGLLKITALRENYKNKEFTSARIVSKDLFDFMYGRVDVRAKLPKGGGTWPAIWMIGSNFDEVNWPQSGEIDIMEYDYYRKDKIHTTVHMADQNGDPVYFTSIKNNISNVSEEFHIYSLEWTSNELIFLIDNVIVYSFKNNPTYPFNQKFFFILNVAVGGNFVGNRVDSDFSEGVMEIDYIRVYK